MDWMLAMGNAGLAGEYTLPPDADIQSTSQIKVIDILSMWSSTLWHLLKLICLQAPTRLPFPILQENLSLRRQLLNMA